MVRAVQGEETSGRRREPNPSQRIYTPKRAVASSPEVIPADQPERLRSLRLNEVHSIVPYSHAQPAFVREDDPTGERYYSQTLSVQSFIRQLSETERVSILRELKQLGLQDLHFTVFTRFGEQLSDVNIKRAHLHVLLHGWTATEEISYSVFTPDGGTVVERILQRDPRAIIVVPTAGGSGRSTFLPDVLNDKKRLKKHLSVDSYVDQAHFLITKVLGVRDMGKVWLKGHSRGGAAVLRWAMRFGCHRAEADAPAFILSKKWRKLIEKSLCTLNESTIQEDINEIWRSYGHREASVLGVKLSAENLYQLLGVSMGVGARVAALFKGAEVIGSSLTAGLFNHVLKRDLLGKIVFPKDWKVGKLEALAANIKMWRRIGRIHSNEIRETEARPKAQLINSFSILSLSEGQTLGQDEPSLEALDVTEIQRLQSAFVLAAKHDTLATLPDMKQAIAGLAVLALLKYHQAKNAASLAPQERTSAMQEAMLAYVSASNLLAELIEIEGGHYATFYWSGFEEKLVPQDNSKPMARMLQRAGLS